MSIRKRDVHFSDWTKVRHALVCNNVQGITETSPFEDVRAFLINSESGSNPFYYYVCYIKDTNEIYTHGAFYNGSEYDDSELRELINALEDDINIKANQSDLDILSAEVEENETVIAKALTDLNNNKADKNDIPDVSTLATKAELNLKQDSLSSSNFATVNGTSVFGGSNAIVIEEPDHYASGTATVDGSGFVTSVTTNASGHVTKVSKRALTESDIPSLSADKITSGTISIDRLPAGALERMFVVSSETAAMSATVQEGDVVQVTGNDNKMYFCISNTATTFANKFKEFTAGTATSVHWSGVTGKPDLATQEELDVVDAKFDNYFLVSNFTQANIKSTLGISDWALASAKPSYSWSEIGSRPTALSQFSNDSGFITNNVTGDFSASGLVRGNYLSTGYIQISSNIDASLRTSIFGDAGNHWGQIKAFRTGGSASYGSLAGGYAAGILFAMNDTHGFIQLPEAASKAGEAVIGGGTGENIKWSAKLLHSLNYSNYALPITGGTVNGSLTVGGTITSSSIMYATDFSTTSDSRLKDFVSDIDVDFNEIKSIPKKYYYWKDKDKFGSELEIGTSAQDLLNIYPECVKYDKTLDMYSVNYQKLSIIALAAIDKLHERILKLESKLND